MSVVSIGSPPFSFSNFGRTAANGCKSKVMCAAPRQAWASIRGLPMSSPRGLCVLRAPPRQANQKENMIRLTRLNNQALTVNSDLIKFVEQSPDTLITLVSGEKIVVRESSEEVLARVIEFRRSVLQGLSFAWDSSSSHTLPADRSGGGKREPAK